MSEVGDPWIVEITRVECMVKLASDEFKALDAMDLLSVVQPRLVQAGALANTVKYGGHLGEAIHFSVNSDQDAKGVLNAVRGLLQEHGFGCDEDDSVVAAGPSGTTDELMVLMVFEEVVRSCVEKIAETAGHIPRLWDVSQDERAIFRRLFAVPQCGPGGRTVRFSLPVEGDGAALARLREIAVEMGRKVDGKRVLVNESDMVTCHSAFGGVVTMSVKRPSS